jgi:hypothetical protein
VSFAYAPEIWQQFYEVVSVAAATLTGLLAVALSMNIRAVVGSPSRIARAREVIISLTVLLTLSIFVLIPQQGRVALGIELITLSLLVFAMTLPLEARTTRRVPPEYRSWWILRLIGLNSATLAITIAGASLVVGRFGGMLWLIHTTLYSLLWSTYDAWSLIIRLPGTLEGERSDDYARESSAAPVVEARAPARVQREMHHQLERDEHEAADPPRRYG